MNKRAIGVIGAGVIGVGVAQDFAQSSYRVVLIDISDERLDKARMEIKKNIRFHALLQKGGGRINTEAVLDNIEVSTDYELLRTVDFVIENVTENWEIKKKVYSAIDPICSEETVFAANTSAIPITRIASVTNRPSKVIGIHLMNPVPLKPIAEVIRGYHTSEETLEISIELLSSLGKECIVVNDSPGFVTNRVMMLTLNEAMFLVDEGVASVEKIDALFKSCFGHKMGPLETADLIGLDTVLHSLEVLYENFADSKYRPCPLLKKMVDAGILGRKSGKGFYPYAR